MLWSKWRLLAGTLSVMLIIIILSGCAKSTNVFRVGVDDSYPPMEFRDDKNVIQGFDVDLANEIGKKMNKKVEFVSTAWDGIFQALNTDKFDCIISSCSITPDRLDGYAFTKPYLANGQVIVVAPSDNSINKPEDLKGKKVGVQTSTTSSAAAEKYQKQTPFELTKYDQVIQPFADLKTGRINAIVVDGMVARDYITKHPEDYKISSAKLTNEPIGVCFKKANTGLRDQVQQIMDGLKADGTLKALSQKWFGEDLSSNIDEKLVQ